MNGLLYLKKLLGMHLLKIHNKAVDVYEYSERD